ncbi:LOW QUALITY PROTEIN: MANSC domain-containing protein 1 [Dipodomys spectabilis]|uniref:LOW QUALITY PROTEIN: MANSC domain-containing protein 1 n=1 Tax=Dipodomys spectabilis TaxID=105255 RepID=UPI001C540EA8|nr:LOW QUALITY PROTEIN: MANSC domain-containing protein 1 [Dipodomys spectabilis]
MLPMEDCSWLYTLVTLSLLTLRLSAGQKCLSQSLEDVVIDIQSSLARGIRGEEPTHALSQADCLRRCCSTKNITGNKVCNLMIFDARKAEGQPNCYLFFCPSKASCPLKPAAAGLHTHRLIPDDHGAALPHQELTANRASPGPEGTPGTVTPLSPGAHPALGRRRVFLDPQSLRPSSGHLPSQQLCHPNTDSGAPQKPPVPSQPVSVGFPRAGTSFVVPSTGFPAPAEARGATSRLTTSQGPTPAPAMLSLSATAIRATAWGLEEARGRPATPASPLERWLLLGTLLSGVLLLALGLVLLGKALLHALRTRPYSRLDYLINGVYVGI